MARARARAAAARASASAASASACSANDRISAAVVGVSSSFTGTVSVSAADWRTPPLTAHQPKKAAARASMWNSSTACPSRRRRHPGIELVDRPRCPGYDGRRRCATLLGISNSVRTDQRHTTPCISIARGEPRYHRLLWMNLRSRAIRPEIPYKLWKGCSRFENIPRKIQRSRSLTTLPVALSGSESRNCTERGTLKPAIRSRHQPISSSGLTGPW